MALIYLVADMIENTKRKNVSRYITDTGLLNLILESEKDDDSTNKDYAITLIDGKDCKKLKTIKWWYWRQPYRLKKSGFKKAKEFITDHNLWGDYEHWMEKKRQDERRGPTHEEWEVYRTSVE